MNLTNGVLSDEEIINNIENGNVVIEPFIKENLCTSSYDVTLGEYYFREQEPLNSSVYNIYDKKITESVWGDVKQAQYLNEIDLGEDIELNNISSNDKVILINPGETILCHTQEFIGGKNDITTMMKCRSSLGRNFIEICKCAGWGDIGYINRWTMEITNNSRYYTIPLVVGRRCAQIIFFKTNKTMSSYEQKGKYQTMNNIDDIKNTWLPEDMLPKMYKDREIIKNDIIKS